MLRGSDCMADIPVFYLTSPNSQLFVWRSVVLVMMNENIVFFIFLNNSDVMTGSSEEWGYGFLSYASSSSKKLPGR